MNIIAITGKAGSGKDTIASYLHERYYKCWIESFAKPLKEACAAAFGIPIENFQDTELKEQTDEFWKVSPRKIAQFVGTEMFRDQMKWLVPGMTDGEFWITRMHALLTGQIDTTDGATYDQEDTIIIPDMRFQNEYRYVSDNGGLIIHLTREGADGTVGIPGHSSESGIIFDDTVYHITNNGSKEDLYAQVEEVLTASRTVLFMEQTTLVQR